MGVCDRGRGRAGTERNRVRPVDCASIRKGLYSQIVACDFSAQAGKRLQGFMIISTADSKVEIAPGAIVGLSPIPTEDKATATSPSLPEESRKASIRPDRAPAS